ncbi:MAG: V-type ATP synthase subunit E [Faecalibacterium sp.]|nr:V-type ATP synthase subunit E [Ruminococcus sp.]MCM1392075.1 V-type ATP synthase subunit E [Ruminococcus sp.]MCM1485000.1 V-type ATP synthase subunit E [Faecalibacterium sp.]
MTGIEKIVDKIAAESAENCASIIENATKQAESIIADARNNARKQAAEIVEKAQKEADRCNMVAKSSAETITRTRYLEVRNAIVNDIVAAAYEEIEKMSVEEYFDLLFKLCVKYVETGECVMYLSQKDVERMPNDFEARINGEVYEKAAVQVSKTPRDIESGFVLDYGDFEINCVLKNIFDESMDNIKDILCAQLF